MLCCVRVCVCARQALRFMFLLLTKQTNDERIYHFSSEERAGELNDTQNTHRQHHAVRQQFYRVHSAYTTAREHQNVIFYYLLRLCFDKILDFVFVRLRSNKHIGKLLLIELNANKGACATDRFRSAL